MTRSTARDDATRSYVLDTCVLLADPNALFRFDEHEVVIPMTVLEELDKHKNGIREIARTADGGAHLGVTKSAALGSGTGAGSGPLGQGWSPPALPCRGSGGVARIAQ